MSNSDPEQLDGRDHQTGVNLFINDVPVNKPGNYDGVDVDFDDNGDANVYVNYRKDDKDESGPVDSNEDGQDDFGNNDDDPPNYDDPPNDDDDDGPSYVDPDEDDSGNNDDDYCNNYDNPPDDHDDVNDDIDNDCDD